MILIFKGKVRQGEKRGRALGFPTANINLSKIIPEGIYLSHVKFQSTTYPALTFIGTARTFNSAKYLSETYILDFDRDLYNKWLSVSLIRKVRDNKKFGSIKELIKQMKSDEQLAKEYFNV